MPTPEPRFEVPPEYAEVYERAYRRAYDGVPDPEEGPRPRSDDQPFVVPAQRGSRAGARRAAVPQSSRSSRERRSPASARGGARRAGRSVTPAGVAAELESEARGPVSLGRRRHRGVSRTGSTLFPLLALVALALILIAGSFVLGRVTADQSPSEPARRRGATPATSPPGSASPSPYAGATVPLRARTVAAGCTSAPGLNPQNVPVGYDATNVLDDDPASAWRCDGDAVGQVLEFTLPERSRVVSLGLVPGYAVTDPVSGVDLYAQNDRITRVTWTVGGRTFDQDISSDTQDRSLRVLRIPETEADRVSLRIDGVEPGPANATVISTVAFGQASG